MTIPADTSPEAIATVRDRVMALAASMEKDYRDRGIEIPIPKSRVRKKIPDFTALAIRQDMWNKRALNLKLYSLAFEIDINPIHRMAVGETYTHLDTLVKPITRRFSPTCEQSRSEHNRAKVTRLLIRLRYRNPRWWTWDRLAKLESKRVRPGRSALGLRLRLIAADPELKKFEDPNEIPPNRRPVYKRTCTECDIVFSTTANNATCCSTTCRKDKTLRLYNLRKNTKQLESV